MKKETNPVIIEVNPKIYPLDVVYSAAYVLIDDYHIILDGDPKKKIKVVILLKEGKKNLKKAASEFNNQLLNYAFYKEQSKKNSSIRQIMLQAALLQTEEVKTEKSQTISPEEEFLEKTQDADFLDDPEGIAVPWEQKYKNKSSAKKGRIKNSKRG